MILKALKYTRFPGEDSEWSIIGNHDDYAYFGNINLLVGKNASGKSRTLEIIEEIAGLLSGTVGLFDAKFESQTFELIFEENEKRYTYFLSFSKHIISEEKLENGDQLILDRKNNLLPSFLRNETIAGNELCICRKSNTTYFFTQIVAWAKSIKSYFFVNQIEKNLLAKDYFKTDECDLHTLNPSDSILLILHKGIQCFGKDFITEVKSDMHILGYNLTKIDIQKMGEGYGIYVIEDNKYIVKQTEMAQGMFRALALFILLTYARLSDVTLCLLIDDLGEGMDYQRSKQLINLAIHKINKSNVQVFMTSNDRYVMNQVPLRYWLVIDRNESKSVFYDYTNSKEVFDDFKYTGLNNFDFLTTDFYSKGFGDEDV